jgi:hypothetical protein
MTLSIFVKGKACPNITLSMFIKGKVVSKCVFEILLTMNNIQTIQFYNLFIYSIFFTNCDCQIKKKKKIWYLLFSLIIIF